MFKLNNFYFKPNKREILIYDFHGAKYIARYLNNEKIELLSVRKEKLSVLIILKCLLKFKFKKKNYIEEFIKYVNPKIIITYIDNNIFFYEIKKFIKTKTIFIQNGLRTCLGDIFADTHDKNLNVIKKFKLKNYYVDYMLVWNNSYGKLYKDFINGESISIGSFRNNITLKKNYFSKKNTILFISNFKNLSSFDRYGSLFYRDYIKNEKKLLLLIRDYCIKNNFRLTVLGKNIKYHNNEKNYFLKFFSPVQFFKFIPASDNRNTYEISTQYDIIVTIESSLGHEMLSRGQKVAFFSTHNNIYPLNTFYFDWLQKKKNKGPFWTNSTSESEIKRVLDYLKKISKYEWHKILIKHKLNLIKIDNNNNIFKNILKKEKMEHCLKKI